MDLVSKYCRFSSLSSFGFREFSPSRRRIGLIRVHKADPPESNVKTAKLWATKRERIRLPDYSDIGGDKEKYHISEFLSHPSGVEAILNTRALKQFDCLDVNTYRCTLPQIQLLNIEVAPVLDLQVIPTSEDCLVQMLSCKFVGSQLVQRQNDHFSASMRNRITWETIDSDSYLDVDVKLNLSLEIYTRPFTLLPISAVEAPGNLVMQALLERLVPLLLQQLLQDYDKWIQQQCQ